MRKPGFKSSLGGKLLLAVALIAGFPAATGVLGWFELRDVARNHSRLLVEAIPAITEVRGVVEETSRVVAMAPELAAVTEDRQRVERVRFLLEEVDSLRDRILRHAAGDDDLSGEAVAAAAAVRASIVALDRLVRQRLALLGRHDAQLRRGLAAAAELTEIADTLVANAEMGTAAVISTLYETEAAAPGALATRPDTLEALDKLIEVDLFQLGLMFGLRAHASEIGLLLNRFRTLTSHEELAALRADLDGRLAVVSRRILSVQDPRRAARALELLPEIRPTSPAPPVADGLLASASGLIDLAWQIEATGAELRATARSLEIAAAALADRIEARAVAAGATAAQAIGATQRLYASSALLALALSLAVLWFYVRGNLVRRLENLSATMLALAGGGSVDPVRPSGRDEIARMEGAVEVFRRQSVANRALEAERDRHLEELRAHRNELQRLVDDRTEQLRGEVAAHDAARLRAESADRAKSEFLAMMSHEIRTAMNGVLGMLRALAREGLTARQSARLDVALASGMGLMGLLNNILDYSKLDSGLAAEEAVEFELGTAIGDIALLMAPMAEEKGLRLRVQLPPGPQPRLRGEMGKLRQILFNLVSNAVKFTATGEVVLRVEVPEGTPEGEAGRRTFRLAVEDTGKGIAPEALERIFAPFQQEDARTARTYGGTGLGLAISQRLAGLIGGRITAASTPGRGACFVLEVAFDIVPPGDAAAPGPAAASLPALPPLRLLAVEDHPVNQEVLRSCLEHMGHRLRILARAERVADLVAAGGVDAVLMDVDLPGISGIEATRRIRALPPGAGGRLPVIGLSAHVQPEDVAACRAAGMDEVLPKPLSPEALARALARHCAPAGPAGARDGAADRAPAPDPGATGATAGVLADLGPERTLKMVGLMLDRLRPETAAIIAALHEGRTAERRQRAHRLKGAAGNFRLPQLVALLETLAHGDETAATPAAARALQAAMEKAEADLEGARAMLAGRGLMSAAP